MVSPEQPRGQSDPHPSRFELPSVFTWLVLVGFLAFFIQGITAVDVEGSRLIAGVGNMGDFISRAVPPDLSRLGSISGYMLETLNMAIVGVAFGVVLSVPLALLSSRNTTPHPVVRVMARGVTAVLRTIPELIWALIFVAAVGLGPLAGILAIIMDTIGFCARFFAERIEEIRAGPSEAIQSTGGGRSAVIFGAILPEAMPSMTATSLFGVEKAIPVGRHTRPGGCRRHRRRAERRHESVPVRRCPDHYHGDRGGGGRGGNGLFRHPPADHVGCVSSTRRKCVMDLSYPAVLLAVHEGTSSLVTGDNA